MSEDMMTRLKKNNFSYPFKHITVEGSHTEPVKHFDKIEAFLAENFLPEDQENRLR